MFTRLVLVATTALATLLPSAPLLADQQSQPSTVGFISESFLNYEGVLGFGLNGLTNTFAFQQNNITNYALTNFFNGNTNVQAQTVVNNTNANPYYTTQYGSGVSYYQCVSGTNGNGALQFLPFRDVLVPTDANGNPVTNANFTVSFVGDNASVTNTVKLLFVPGDGHNFSTDANDQFADTFLGQGLTNVVHRATPPQAFWVGAKVVRMIYCGGLANSAGNGFFNEIRLNGWKPVKAGEIAQGAP